MHIQRQRLCIAIPVKYIVEFVTPRDVVVSAQLDDGKSGHGFIVLIAGVRVKRLAFGRWRARAAEQRPLFDGEQ